MIKKWVGCPWIRFWNWLITFFSIKIFFKHRFRWRTCRMHRPYESFLNRRHPLKHPWITIIIMHQADKSFRPRTDKSHTLSTRWGRFKIRLAFGGNERDILILFCHIINVWLYLQTLILPAHLQRTGHFCRGRLAGGHNKTRNCFLFCYYFRVRGLGRACLGR